MLYLKQLRIPTLSILALIAVKIAYDLKFASILLTKISIFIKATLGSFIDFDIKAFSLLLVQSLLVLTVALFNARKRKNLSIALQNKLDRTIDNLF